jgi:glyoxylase-like metal-dependent hydrolase (beta-lactamase superfamily II)
VASRADRWRVVKIAERWFDTKRVDDEITLLREPHVYSVWQSNIWHVRGRDRDLLVDAGMGIGSLSSALQPLLDKPLVAVATHRHSDHVGGLHEFSERVAHPLDAEVITTAEGFASIVSAEFPKGFDALMREMYGAPPPQYLIDALPHGGYDPHAYRIEPAPLTRFVSEGDEIDLGDRVFEVLHLPGHTPGSIGLWDVESGTLFSGDAIYDGPLYDFLPESNVADYLLTMTRLRALPVDVVHGGHDPSFGRERMLAIIDEYERTRRGPSGT